MLVRSALVDLQPFRTGLAVSTVGLMIALGTDHGGAVGSGLGGGLARVIGDTGALIVGVALLLAGTLLFTGASAGAILRGSGHAMRRAGRARGARSTASSCPSGSVVADDRAAGPPASAAAVSLVDGAAKYPDIVCVRPRPRPEPPRSCCRGSTSRTT